MSFLQPPPEASESQSESVVSPASFDFLLFFFFDFFDFFFLAFLPLLMDFKVALRIFLFTSSEEDPPSDEWLLLLLLSLLLRPRLLDRLSFFLFIAFMAPSQSSFS